uniref:Uncharacterized protein n=1 Tax=Romanomermis culicivorax TaxID=13658 RepID=A0A915LA20_ROMCU
RPFDDVARLALIQGAARRVSAVVETICDTGILADDFGDGEDGRWLILGGAKAILVLFTGFINTFCIEYRKILDEINVRSCSGKDAE